MTEIRPTPDHTGSDERQEYIDGMVRKRGYVLEYHKTMVQADYEVLKAVDNLVNAAYLKQRTLDRGTKELLFILSLTVLRASKAQIQSHIDVALKLGLTPEAILEAIEISLPEAGVVVFQEGFEAWREAVGATGIEPSVTSFDGSRSVGEASDVKQVAENA